MGCGQSTSLPSVTEQFDDVEPRASDGVEDLPGTSVEEGEAGGRKLGSSGACSFLPTLRSGKKSSEKFSVDLWNAFDDGTVVALKTADEKRYLGIVAVAHFFLNTLDSLAQGMAGIVEEHGTAQTRVSNEPGEPVTIDKFPSQLSFQIRQDSLIVICQFGMHERMRHRDLPPQQNAPLPY